MSEYRDGSVGVESDGKTGDGDSLGLMIPVA
jgi:hypothetical protein